MSAPGLGFLVTFFDDFRAQKKREETLSLEALAELMRTTSAPQKESLPWLKLAQFGPLPTEKGSLRWDGNVRLVSGLEADYDAEKLRLDEAVERLERAGVEAIVYTSPSHRPDTPRWRVLWPLLLRAVAESAASHDGPPKWAVRRRIFSRILDLDTTLW